MKNSKSHQEEYDNIQTAPSRIQREITNFYGLDDHSSDKYTLDGWPCNAFPNSSSVDMNSSAMESSYDSGEMKGIEVFWRVGADKYVISNALYGSSNETLSSRFDSKNVPLRYSFKDGQEFATKRANTQGRDELDTMPSAYCRANGITSTDVSFGSTSSGSSDGSGRASLDLSGFTTNNDATYNSTLSSTANLVDQYHTPPSTTVVTTSTLSTKSDHSNRSSFLSTEGSSFMETSREEATNHTINKAIRPTQNEDDQDSQKRSSLSYSSTSYSTNVYESDDLASLLFSDRIESLFVETLDEHESGSSVASDSSSELCNSEICVDAIVDLPWIFDDLNEDCHDECNKMNNELDMVKAIILDSQSSEERHTSIEKSIKVHTSSQMKRYLKHQRHVARKKGILPVAQDEKYNRRLPFTLKDETSISSMQEKAVAQKEEHQRHKECLVDLNNDRASQQEEPIFDLVKEIDKTKAVLGDPEYLEDKRDAKDKYGMTPVDNKNVWKEEPSSQNISKCSTTNEIRRIRSSSSKSNMSSKDDTPKLANTRGGVKSSTLGDDKKSLNLSDEATAVVQEDQQNSKEYLSTDASSNFSRIERSCDKDEEVSFEELVGNLISIGSQSPTAATTKIKSVSVVGQQEGMSKSKSIELPCINGYVEESIENVCYLDNSKMEIIEENNAIEMKIKTIVVSPLETKNVHDRNERYPYLENPVVTDKIKVDSKNMYTLVESSQSVESSVNQTILNSVFKLIPSLCIPREEPRCDTHLQEVTTRNITPLSDITVDMSFDRIDVPNNTFQPTTYLVTCIYERAWEDSLVHLETNPLEARIWVAMKSQVNNDGHLKLAIGNNDLHDSTSPHSPLIVLPIHAACYFKAPLELIKNLINIYPEAIKQKAVDNARLPLHIACEVEADPEIVTFLINAWPLSMYVYDGDGNIALTKIILSKPLTQRKREIMKVLLEETKKVSELHGNRLKQKKLI